MSSFIHNSIHHRRSQSMFSRYPPYPGQSVPPQPLIPQSTSSSSIVPGPPASTASLSYVPASHREESDSKSMRRSKSKSRLSINLPSFFGSDHSRSSSRHNKAERVSRTDSVLSTNSSMYVPPFFPNGYVPSRGSSQDSEESGVQARPKTPGPRVKTPHLRITNPSAFIPPESPHSESPIHHVKTSDDDAERWSFAGSDSASNSDSNNSWIDGSAHGRQGSTDHATTLRYQHTGGGRSMGDKEIYSAAFRAPYQNFQAMMTPGPTKMPISPASSMEPSYSIAQPFQAPQFQAPQFPPTQYHPSQIMLDPHMASNPASPMSFPLIVDIRRTLASVFNLSMQAGAVMTKFDKHDLPATNPPVQKMTIVSPWFSQPLEVDGQYEGNPIITIGMILSSLHKHLRQKITPEQWNSLAPEHQKQIEATYQANRSPLQPARPDLENGNPLLIDTVGENCYFMGLVRDENVIKQRLGEAAVHDTHNVAYVAILGKSIVKWKMHSPSNSQSNTSAVGQVQMQAPPRSPGAKFAQALHQQYPQQTQQTQQHQHQQQPPYGYPPNQPQAQSAVPFGMQGANNYGGWSSAPENLPASIPMMTGSSNGHRPGPRPVQRQAPPTFPQQYAPTQPPHNEYPQQYAPTQPSHNEYPQQYAPSQPSHNEYPQQYAPPQPTQNQYPHHGQMYGAPSTYGPQQQIPPYGA